MLGKTKKFRVAYAIQNVGGIDFSQDFGDTVPVKYTLRGLRKAGYDVSCLMLRGLEVVGIDNVADLKSVWKIPLGISDKKPFRFFESGVRRIQRELQIPYFAFFDGFRFYEASYRCLPQFTLCHEHNGLFCVGAALACSQLGIPYVLTFSADPLFERALGGRPLRGIHHYIASLEAKISYRVAKRIICVSESAKRHLVEDWQVNPEKIVVMPNGVDVDLFHPGFNPEMVREKIGIGKSDPVIGFVGGFQTWHGIDRLVESFARILKIKPAAKLLLIGDGRARQVVEEKIAACGVGPAVLITGFVPQEQVPELMAAIDVAVLPYPQLPRELWFSPLKLYEYMAASKAIVASRSGQIAEVIQDGYNGLLVQPGDVDALTAAIVRLLEDQALREELACNARRQAIEQHSWDRYIQALLGIYQEALT
jgi:glycosyltransferase involved in cell wall biosynthesis